MNTKASMRWLWPVGLFVLVGLAVGGWARYQYGQQLVARVWPQNQFEFPLRLPVSTGSNTVMLLGDSRMAEWGSPQIPGWQMVNAGVSGITSAQLAVWAPGILRQVRPQVVVIQVGINDLKLLGLKPKLREAVVAGCVSNIMTVVEAGRQNGARVILTDIWPTGKISLARWLVWSSAVAPAVVEANQRLHQRVAAEAGVRMVDLLAGFPAREQAGWYRDTLHLKPAAYNQLSEFLAVTLASEK